MINFAENLNKMITAGLGGETEAPRTEVAVGHRIQYLEASGSVASFETNIVAPLKKVLVTMLLIQAGSGDPSPDNIRPISGRDSVTVTRVGKNLFDKSQTFERGNITENGSIGTGAGYTHTDYIRVKGNTTYTTSGNIINGAGRNAIAFYDANMNFLYRHLPSVPGGTTFTTPAECKYIRMNLYLQTAETLATIQLEEGNTASDFEPYDGSSVTIQLGQTVYGGTLDAVSGKLTVSWGMIESYDGETLPGEWISDRDVYVPGTTPTAGAQVCYELETPLTVDLTPQQIATLIGENNVWSNTGDVDVTYIYYEETEGY